jgi:succinyl-CoA synthetase alpha subunit
MSILVGSHTRLLVQGITGKTGTFHTQHMIQYGTNIVAGVTPGKEGASVLGVPVFNTVSKAVRETGANASVIYVPPRSAADSILEGIDAGLDVIVCITEGIPVLDMARIKHYLNGKKTRLVGPNCPGVLSPGEKCKVGIMPGNILIPGHVGVISRSGTLTYEAVAQLTAEGIGQSTAVGIGGDPIKGMGFIDTLELFAADADTHAVVMIGEIGGNGEVEAAGWIKEHMPDKPVAVFVAGRTAPAGKRMGHAGAIISGPSDSAGAKIEKLSSLGLAVAETPDKIGAAMVGALKKSGIYEKCLTVE